MPTELRGGLGCMRLSTEQERDEELAFETIAAAVDAGVTVFDTARSYGEDDLGHWYPYYCAGVGCLPRIPSYVLEGARNRSTLVRGADRLRAAVAAVCISLVFASAAATAAEEDTTSKLTAPLAVAARPGSTIVVRWLVSPTNDGGATFVRLLSRVGGSPVTVAGVQDRDVGHYTAKVRVPAGGIGGIRIGIRRSREIILPLTNDPFLSASGLRCDVVAVKRILTRFVDAYRRGDTARLDSLFSRKAFHWYATSGPGVRELPEARRRGTLLAYFRERHRQNDRIILRSYRFTGYERERRLGHFSLAGRRRADDFRSGGWFRFVGKGALDCSQSRASIAVMFIGGPTD